MNMDYRDILKRYIDYVSLVEGQFYWPTDEDFSAEECKEIETLINQIVQEDVRDV